jgi:hypothetical protein
MAKGDRVNKGQVEKGKGYKVKTGGKTHKGHVMEITEEYVIIHDAKTREHKKIMFIDVDGNGDLDEVEADWM